MEIGCKKLICHSDNIFFFFNIKELGGGQKIYSINLTNFAQFWGKFHQILDIKKMVGK
jgi:hypothetical protein